jgi:Thiamine pyrophosphate enzyme, N-terminal TPP binding domain
MLAHARRPRKYGRHLGPAPASGHAATIGGVIANNGRLRRDTYHTVSALTKMGDSAMSKRVADVLIETLQAAGVKRCYGIVGDTLNRIAQAIHESEIEWVHMRHE